MADVGLGQRVAAFLRLRSKAAKDAVTDNHPIMAMLKEEGGIRRESGGRTVLDEALSGQNSTVAWVGEAGTASLVDDNVVDSPEFSWAYLLGSLSLTLAEKYMNSGAGKSIDILVAKTKALEASSMNTFHEGLLSSGTGSGGLQIDGLAALVSTTPTSGTVGGIDRSSANAAWFRNQKFDTSGDWSDGAVDAGNVKRFLDKGINATTRNSKTQVSAGLLGQTHFEFLTQATQAIQVIQNQSDTAKVGFDRIIYRGVPMFYGTGISYSGLTQMTATRTYLLNLKEGGFNVVFHKDAEFDLLEPVNSADQAAFSRLMFTMATCTIGAFAKQCWVGFD